MNRQLKAGMFMFIFTLGLPVGVLAATYDLSITKTSDLTAAASGDTVEYTLTLDNSGPDAASNVTVTDQLDINTTYQSDMTGTCSYSSAIFSDPTLTISNVSVGAGGSCTLTYTVVADSAPSMQDWLIVPGRVTLSGMTWNRIEYGRTYNSIPVVLAIPTTDNNGENTPIPVLRNVGATGFEIALCVDGGSSSCDGSPSAENVDYFVVNMDLIDDYSWIDAGTFTLPSDDTQTTDAFNITFANTPSVWATPQTYSQGGNIAMTIWADDNEITNSQAEYKGCVHQGTNNSCDTGQPSETVARLAIDTTTVALNTFEAGIQSTNNNNRGAISFENKVSPYVMSMVNDDNGGQDPKNPWVRDIVSAGADVRFCEQDGANDCDNHSANNSAWFVLDGYMHYINNAAALSAADDTDSSNNLSISSVPMRICGNGITEGAEICDDANTDNGDGCPNNCGITVCGDGIPEGTEECDDGDSNNNNACKNDCTANICGDSYTYSGVEECDDGNVITTDICDTSGATANSSGACTLTFCGDGTVQNPNGYAGAEQCDNGWHCEDGTVCDTDTDCTGIGGGLCEVRSVFGCNTSCQNCTDADSDNFCSDYDCNESNPAVNPATRWYKDIDGDGYGDNTYVVQCAQPANYYLSGDLTAVFGDCDDSDEDKFPTQTWYEDVDGDGHSSGTTLVQCDQPTDYYLSGSLTSIAGDNCPVDANPTQSDVDSDGNGDACDTPECGDGYTDVGSGEQCDDGGTATGDGCDEFCMDEVCGNGLIQAGEECDDGGIGTGDGCNGSCAIETGWDCSGQPSVCTVDCGDGIVGVGEECDDGGVANGDGCSSSCQWEIPTCSLSSTDTTVFTGEVVDVTYVFTGGATGWIDLDSLDFDNGTVHTWPILNRNQDTYVSSYVSSGDKTITLSISNNLPGAGTTGQCTIDIAVAAGICDLVNIPVDECLALRAIYQSTNGASWSNNSNWLSAFDVDTWHGVTIAQISGVNHVTDIGLDSNNVAGIIPDAAGDLVYLNNLSLNDNNITSLAAGIGGMVELDTLYLNGNNMISLPSSIDLLDDLNVLSVANNSITSLPATIGGMASLDALYIQGNNLGTFPSSIGSLSNLDTLNANSNAITTLPGTIGDLSDLESLYLDGNDLTVLPDQIGNLANMTLLSLNDNSSLTTLPSTIDGWDSLVTFNINNAGLTSLPDEFGDISVLQYFYAQSNELTTLPTTIGDLDNLDTMDLRANDLTSLPVEIGDMLGLNVLYLQTNDLTSLPAELGDLPALDELHLNDNDLTSIPSELGDLSTLRFMYLHNNDIQGAIPDNFSNLTSMLVFYAYNNNFTRTIDPTHNAYISPALSARYGGVLVKLIQGQGDIVAPTVSSTTEIPLLVGSGFVYTITVSEESYIQNNAGDYLTVHFTGAVGCDNLQTNTPVDTGAGDVDLVLFSAVTGNYNSCAVVIEDHGGNLSNAQAMDDFIYGGSLEDICGQASITVPQSECEALIELYVATDGPNWINSTNWITNTDIETWFGVRTNIYNSQEHVDGIFLHKRVGADGHGQANEWLGNRLVGEIPLEIGDFPELRDLNLSVNFLSGTIPSTIGNLTNVKTVYFFNNELEGNLPSSIANLDEVTTFHVGDNNLTGSLPVAIGDMDAIGALDLSQNQFEGAIPTELGDADTIWFLRLNNNLLNGNLPSSMGNLSGMTHLYLNNNSFTGRVPTSFANMNVMSNLYLQFNNLDRNNDYDAILDSPLPTWYLGFNSKDIGNQGDITAPVILATGSIPAVATSAFDYTITIDENSFAITNGGNGIPVAFTGEGLCPTIQSSDVMISSGTTGIVIAPQSVGIYNGCILYVTDHGSNTSNTAVLPDFAYDDTNTSVCFDDGLNISVTECLALGSLYNSASGENWTDSSNWLSNPDVSTWYGIGLGGASSPYHVSVIDLSGNNLSGTLIGLENFTNATVFDFSNNTLGGNLPNNIAGLSNLTRLDLENNNFAGSLPTNYGNLTALSELNLGSNNLNGSIPEAWSGLSNLIVLDLGLNSLDGDFPQWVGSLTNLVTFDVEGSSLLRTFPAGIAATNLDSLNVSGNNMDRDYLHQASIPAALASFFGTITTKVLGNQSDVTAPIITSSHTFTGNVGGSFTYPININENSYAVNALSEPMEIDFTGSLHCGLVSASTGVFVNTGQVDLTIIPYLEGTHSNCRMLITDHAGNVGQHVMPTFVYDLGCGDGQIGPGEDCDEGRRCSDNTDCTADPNVCADGPADCQARFVGSCNPGCRTAKCGDRYIDPDGQDNVPDNQDDETCDEGSYCDNGVDCTNDASVCPTGELECFPRNVNGCNPACIDAVCGDGEVDQNGPDNIPDTADDEECDDGDANSWTGACTPTCKNTYCGDGAWQQDGPDGIPGNADDEECDAGQNNGLILSDCSSTCELAGEACAWCWEYCDGGTGKHSVYLLIDVSGSMGDDNKLETAISGAKTFVSLLPEVEYDGYGNVSQGTKVGLISYQSNATVEIAPTDDHTGVIAQIDSLSAGGSTNFSDALDEAYDYFLYNDTDLQQHVVMLSDGEPTVPTNGDGPHWWGMYSANRLKNLGVDVYTISYDQDEAGVEYMKDISSNTYRNQAYAKPVNQSSTFRTWFIFWWIYYPVERTVDWNRSTDEYAMTEEDPYAWWEIDLGTSTWIDKMWAWNRGGGTADETADYYVHVSDSDFASDSLPTTLADANVSSIYFPGVMGYPSKEDINLTGRYARIQLSEDNSPGSDNLGLSEVMFFGCKASDSFCGTGFNYVDYNGDIIDLLYSHIYGAIQCGCTPDMICNICGDNFIQADEQCDEGSFCDDGTPCTGEPEICPSECRPRYSDTCTETCEFPYCGDGVVNDFSSGQVCVLDQSCGGTSGSCQDQIADFEILSGTSCTTDADCDDVAGVPGAPNEYISYCREDGQCALVNDYCLSTDVCTTSNDCSAGYVCQDAYKATVSDPQGIKRCVLESCTSLCNSGSSVSEECDDGNLLDGDGCNSECRVEYCGDGFWDPDGGDNNPFPPFQDDNEECDDGNDIDGGSGDYCTNDCKRTNYQSGDGQCVPFTGIYNFSGDGSNYPGYPSLNVNDLCVLGSLSGYTYDATGHSWSWECVPSGSGEAATCLVPEYFCGDGYMGGPEECDDGGFVASGYDGCNDSCALGPPLIVPAVQGNSCIETRLPVVQIDEYLPMRWSVIPVQNVDTDAVNCQFLEANTQIPGQTMMCKFSVARAGDPEIAVIDNVPCLDTDWKGTNASLFNGVPIVADENPVVGNYYLENLPTIVSGNLGQYMITLDEVRFDFCTQDLSGGWVANAKTYQAAGNAPICDMKFAVLDGYLLQKGVGLSSVENTSMSVFEDASGAALTVENTLSTANEGTVQIENSSAIDFIADGLIAEFGDSASVSTSLRGVDQSEIYKVPSKEIYFYKGADPLTINYDLGSITQKPDPYTLVIENADLIIEGTLRGRGMYVVPNGTIEFENTDCVQPTGEEVRGIFVAGSGFVTDTLRNNNLNNANWCRGGSLVIDGLLIGGGINQGFANNRRAVLDLWDNSVNFFLNQAEELGNQLYSGYYQPLIQSKVVAGDIPVGDVDYGAIHNAFKRLDIPWLTNKFAPWNGDGVYLLPADINAMETMLTTHNQAENEKRNKLFDGAAVLIKTNPGMWDNPPPGVKTFFEDIVITK